MCAWREVEGNLATPRGFRAAAVAAGIKKVAGALDLALIFSDARDTAAAGMFTTNRVTAAPVELSRRHLKETRGWARAVVVNSGNANACTGAEGLRTSQETARAAAKLLGLSPRQVLVASTGVIGVPLKLDLILSQLPALSRTLSTENADDVARPIRTTDTFSKSCVLRTEAGVRSVYLAGVAKGAGMIHPRMATMLAFITTDAAVAPTVLRDTLRAAVNGSFNRLTVDGDTSTNDTVLVLASGASGVTVRSGAKSASWFAAGLAELCQTLAKL